MRKFIYRDTNNKINEDSSFTFSDFVKNSNSGPGNHPITTADDGFIDPSLVKLASFWSPGNVAAGLPIVTDSRGMLDNSLIHAEELSSLIDHSVLLNLANDDHKQYLLADGTRALTGIQKYATAQTFTDAKSLVSKKYVDDSIAGIVFGANYNYAESLAESTTTALAFSTKVSLTATLPVGNYRVNWSFMAQALTSLLGSEFKVVFDGTTIFDCMNVLSTYSQVSGFKRVSVAAAGPKTFVLQFNQSVALATTYIKNASLDLWQVP